MVHRNIEHKQRTCSRKCGGIIRRGLTWSKIKPRPCIVCGGMFKANRSEQRYCSASCFAKNKRIDGVVPGTNGKQRYCRQCGTSFRHITRDQWNCARCRESITFRSQCRHCGNEFEHQPPVNRAEFCSESCRRLARGQRIDWVVSVKTCVECGTSFDGIPNQLACSAACRKTFNKKLYKPETKTKRCPVCRDDFVVTFSATQTKYCSETCARTGYTWHCRAAGSLRRARIRGVEHERINPLRLFDRDGWHCQICGIATPKKLRGTYNKRAPELDHRIPIAMGGGHTWSNVQLACRSCNARKGGHTVVGQLPLIAHPMMPSR